MRIESDRLTAHIHYRSLFPFSAHLLLVMSDNTGAEYVAGVFKETEDAFDAISNLQQENRVRISSMQPALPILDLHDVSRAEVHSSLFQTMQDKLLGKVGSLDTRGLTKLLDRCFRHIGGDAQLRDVCLMIMQKLPKVDEKYLHHIADNPDLYAACPAEVKRQIWQSNQSLFGEAVSPLLDQYIAEKDRLMFGTLTKEPEKKPTSFLSFSPKVRRQSSIVQELVSMVGNSQQLYSIICQFLKTLYLRTRIPHYCTLRADILMSLHEKVSPLSEADPCRKFAWCLDACIRAGCIDGKKSRELFTFLEQIEGGQELWVDVAMLLRDPYALDVLCKSILQCLLQIYEQNKLPRESSELEFLVRLIGLAFKSLTLLETKEYYESKLDVELIVKFLPELLSLMVDNALRGVYRQLKEDHTPFSASNGFTSCLSKHPSAMHITCTYALHLMEKKDMKSLSLLLPMMAKRHDNQDAVSVPDVFLHLLVMELTQQFETLRESTLLSFLNDFWVPCCQNSESVLLHFCRFFWTFHARLNPTFLAEILEAVNPSEELSQVARDQYEALIEHIESEQQQP